MGDSLNHPKARIFYQILPLPVNPLRNFSTFFPLPQTGSALVSWIDKAINQNASAIARNEKKCYNTRHIATKWRKDSLYS